MNYQIEIIKICAEIFETDCETITIESTPETIDHWDSFNTLRLISKIESEYKISFEFDELVKIKKINDIIWLVRDKKGV